MTLRDQGVAAAAVDGRAPLKGEVPLGAPREGLRGLPASWALAVRACPWCAATPGRAGGRACFHCEGTGDMLGMMLLDAYRRGRDHVFVRLREVDEARKFAVRRVREEEPSREALRRAMGL